MNTERATPGAGFWAAVVLLAAPIFYFASIGPVAWGFSRLDSPPAWIEGVVNVYFIPAELVCTVSPEPVEKAMVGYCELFAGRPPP